MAYSKRSIFIVPEGTIRFCAETALTTSTGESPLACKRVKIQIDLDLALLASIRVRGLCSFDGGKLGANAVLPDIEDLCRSAHCRTCRAENGNARCVVLDDERWCCTWWQRSHMTWLMAVTWATALPILTWGWKKTLMTPMPFNDCDSMCSISLTAVVMPRSTLKTMRVDISCADSPV